MKSERKRSPLTQRAKNMRHKKRVFAAAVAGGLGLRAAAIKAGAKPIGAHARANEMLHDPDVQRDIAVAQKAAIDYMQLDVNIYFEQLHAIATADIADIFDNKGCVLPLHKMTKQARMALAGIDVVLQNVSAGDGFVDHVMKPRYHDKLNAIVTMLKAHGKLVSKVERGRPGEFDRLSRAELRQVIEQELAPAAGLRLVAKK